MNSPLIEIQKGISSKLETFSHLSPEVKAFGCALAILVGVGGLVVAGVGGGGYLGAISHLDQVQSMVMMATGTSGGIIFLTGGIIAAVKNCQKKKETPIKENSDQKPPKRPDEILIQSGSPTISDRKIEKIPNQTFLGMFVPNEIFLHILSFIDDFKSCLRVCNNWRLQSHELIKQSHELIKLRKNQFTKAAENGQLKLIETIALGTFKNEIGFMKPRLYKEIISCYALAERIIYLGKIYSFEIWELDLQNQWKCIQTIDLSVWKLFYKGKKLFSELINGAIKIWKFDQQKKELKCIDTLDNTSDHIVKRFTNTANSMFINEEGILLFRSEKKHIQAWKILNKKWEHVQTLQNHHNCVTALDYVGNMLVSGTSDEPEIKIWKRSPHKSAIYKDRQWHCKYTIMPRKQVSEWSKWETLVCLHCTEQMIFAGTNSKTIYIWNFDSEMSQWKPIQFVGEHHYSSGVTSLLFVNEIFFRADEQQIYLWKWSKEKGAFQDVKGCLVFSSGESQERVRLSYNKGKLIVSTNNVIDVWAP